MSAPELVHLLNRLGDVRERIAFVQLGVEAAADDEADERLSGAVLLLGEAGDELKAILAALADYETHVDAVADSAAAVAEGVAMIAGTGHRARAMAGAR